jgi:plastocyanin/heme-degrading monooxygenase HmoA
MEYIQTILFQIPASRLEQASQGGGLLSEMDEHRTFLRQQAGFRDLRITRSINNEGNILVVVETRWSDDDSLVRYETNEPNVASIVRQHSDVLVSGSLQVLDMEALRTESSWAPAEASLEARERVILPVVIPLGILSFILLCVYGLSRIYLEIGSDGAVALAAGIAVGILFIAAFLASNPKVSGVQIGGIVFVVAATLLGGTIWALLQEGGTEAKAGGETPAVSASPGGATTAPGGPTAVALGDNFFEVNEVKNPTITVTAGAAATLNITNNGPANTHNMHVASTDETFEGQNCTAQGKDPCSVPNIIGPGKTATIAINLPAGTYAYRCDFHSDQMHGTLEIK